MKIAVLTLLALLLGASFTAVAADKPAFFELRIYRAPAGKLPELLTRFRDHTVKLFAKHGMTNIGYWTPMEEKDGSQNTLVYFLGYPSLEAREKSWKDFMADPDWQAAHKASEVNGKLVEKVESIYLKPTEYSMFNFETSATQLAFELRTYTTFDGKLDALHARFKNVTLKMFEKYGMTNILYTTPTQEKDGAGKKLIYLLAHKDKAAHDSAFTTFRADADWVKAKAESEKDGPLTIENGVVSLMLTPTDFSPLK